MADTDGRGSWSQILRDPLVKSLIGTVTLLVVISLILAALNDVGEISFAFMASHWGFLVRPALTALEVTVISFVVGFSLAIPLGVVRAFGPGIIRQRGLKAAIVSPLYAAVTGYAEAIRGTPLFMQLLMVEIWVTTTFRGVAGVSFWAGVLALTFNTTAYQTEVFRAGFQSVGQGQIEAAKSIGLRPAQTFANITFPQGIRLITLPLANEWIALFKASSLLWWIAVQELLWGMEYLGVTLNHPIDAFVLGSFFYIAILFPLGRAVTFIERRRRIPGLGVAEPSRGRLLGIRVARKAPG